MTAETLALIAGVVLSLLFSYIPGFNAWFAALEGVYKRLIMLSLVLVTALVIFGLSCAEWVIGGIGVTCDQAGILMLVEMFIIVMIANQSMFLASPQTKKVKAAKA